MYLFSMHYLPSIAWFQYYLYHTNNIIDRYEHFVKQTYRNRCYILSANGVQPLIIPVKHNNTHKTAMHVLLPDNYANWQQQHWQSIQSAYGKSPFFIHYKHYFEPIYQSSCNNIFSFNLTLLQAIFSALKININVNLSNQYINTIEAGNIDLRAYFNTKQPRQNQLLFNKPYTQVFCDKFSFEPNLSILDLLFNEGPRAKDFLFSNC